MPTSMGLVSGVVVGALGLVACGDKVAHLPDAPVVNSAPMFTSTPPAMVHVVIAAEPSFTAIELTPTDVGSTSTTVFSTLPSADASIFGLTGADVRVVNFDTVPGGGGAIASETTLTTEYAALGVTMDNIRVSGAVYGGAASPPNATTSPAQVGATQQFTFSVPVVALGLINTSPDQDTFEFYDANGELIHSTRDQDGAPGPDFSIDRFVGARSNNDRLIASMRLVNASGNMELDEMVFEVSNGQLAYADLGYTAVADDPDGDALTYTLVAGPTGATVDATTGVVSWRPSNLDAGDHAFTLRVEDGQGGSAEQTFTVTVTVVFPI